MLGCRMLFGLGPLTDRAVSHSLVHREMTDARVDHHHPTTKLCLHCNTVPTQVHQGVTLAIRLRMYTCDQKDNGLNGYGSTREEAEGGG